MQILRKKYWRGSVPVNCDCCKEPFDLMFLDARVRHEGKDIWGKVCPKCHGLIGYGIGIGNGQCYYLLAGRWQSVQLKCDNCGVKSFELHSNPGTKELICSMCLLTRKV